MWLHWFDLCLQFFSFYRLSNQHIILYIIIIKHKDLGFLKIVGGKSFIYCQFLTKIFSKRNNLYNYQQRLSKSVSSELFYFKHGHKHKQIHKQGLFLLLVVIQYSHNLLHINIVCTGNDKNQQRIIIITSPSNSCPNL